MLKQYILAIVLSAVFAVGACARQPQTVHIRVSGAQGSGVLCGTSEDGDKRIVLSVAHVTGESPSNDIIVTVGETRYLARLIGADRSHDVAALWIRNSGEVQAIPPAKLWLGAIDTAMRTRCEGFAGGRFVQTRGRLRNITQATQLVATSESYFGMSGGPTYVDLPSEHATFTHLNSRSDLATMSFGPEAKHIYQWLPTVEHPEFKLTCNSSGIISMSPRRFGGRIRGPVVTPEPPAPSSVPQSGST